MIEYNPKDKSYKQIDKIDPETQEITYRELEEVDFSTVRYKRVGPKKIYHYWWFWLICILLFATISIMAYLLISKSATDGARAVVPQMVAEREEASNTFSEINSGTVTIVDNGQTGKSYTEKIDFTIGEVRFRAYYLHNGVPELFVGDIDKVDNSRIIFAARAADLGSNNRFVGAFVKNGEILGTGNKGKRGFCAIINHNLTIGVATSTPIFEEAVEKKGDFFRNYPVVLNGSVCETNLRKPSIRRAVCVKNSDVFVVESLDSLTMADFSNLLSQYGVETAVYLVGGRACGLYRDENDNLTKWGENHYEQFSNTNYLIWRKR